MKILLRCRFLFFIIFMFLLVTHEIFGQIETEEPVTKQFWIDFNPSYPISEKVELYGSIGVRTIDPNVWNRFLVTPSVKYKRPKLILKKLQYKEELHGGIGFFYTANRHLADKLEIRPFQAYSLTWPNRDRIAIKHYLKLEERFELNTSNWVNTFGLRLRYTASITLRFQGDLWQYGKGFYIPVSVELFWNIKETIQFNDVVRLTAGIGYEINPSWKTAFSVGYDYTRNTIGEGFHTNNILFRFRVYYKFKNEQY